MFASYGSVYSAFASYRTTGTFKVELFQKLILICRMITVFLIICALVTIYILYELWLLQGSQIPLGVFLMLGVIAIMITIPAIVISWDLK